VNQNPSNPYASDEAARGFDTATAFDDEARVGNPYLSARQPGPPPDLDAAAPSLRSAETQRMNRKALGFLAGIIGLFVVIAVWAFSGSAPKSERATPHAQKVVIPELPQTPDAAPVAGAPAVPLQQQPAQLTDLPPLPAEPVALAQPRAVGGYDAPATASVPRPPSLLERRMGLAGAAQGGGGSDGAYAPGGIGGPSMVPGAEAGGGERPRAAEATSATYLQHPDALLVRGTYLRCVLETHIVTDVPGFTSCIVTEPVYSINGRSLLLPKGSKILGHYEGEPNGPRISVIWDRITTPTGIDVNMASPGIDNLGGAGHPGDYNAHWASRISSALLISLISDGFKYAAAVNGPTSTTTSNGTIVEEPFESNTARTLERAANQAIARSMRRPATVTINQGTGVNGYGAKDVDLSNVLATR